MLSKRDFERHAGAIHAAQVDAAAYPRTLSIAVQEANLAHARKLARIFKTNNPRFDKDRFMLACGFSAPAHRTRKGQHGC